MSEADPHAIIRFLRECYRENGSRSGLWNFYGSSVRKRVFIEGEADPVLKDPSDVDSHFLRGKRVEDLAKEAAVYEKERELLYATIFVVGWAERYDGKPEPICAPLFLYPATLEADDLESGAVLQIDTNRARLNAAVLEAIGGDDFFRTIESETESGPLSEGCVGTIRRMFSDTFPDADTAALLNYPSLVKGRELKAEFDRIAECDELPFALVPAAAVALVNKSAQMRGVLNELEEMGNPASRFSPPIRALLGGTDAELEADKPGRIPAHLSLAQKKILESSRKHPLTLAIGPPGTGKSFTIAALAIEAISRGKSVIIASKMDHAVDVAGDKIESAIGLAGAVVRGGRKSYLKDLKKFLEELLAGIHTNSPVDRESLALLNSKVREKEEDLELLEELFSKRTSREVNWGAKLADKPGNWFWKWLKERFEKRLSKRLEAIAPVQDLAAELYRDADEWLESVLDYLGQSRVHYLKDRLQTSRRSFQNFNRAIRARTGTKQEAYFESIAWQDILIALPVWLVNLSDVHKILPHTAELFDLAIIDEASQCDIASVLPILQRANRAVIAGDPKQLRHLSFLPKKRLHEIGTEQKLDADTIEQFNFRDVSLLDLVSDQIHDQSRVAFLNEHFRSRPEIIEFSNREFYAGQLQVMTGNHLCNHQEEKPDSPLRVTHLTGGKRADNGINESEADFIFETLIRISEEHHQQFPENVKLTFGILSPFRNQVDYLRKRLLEHPLSTALTHRNDILIGTAHTFQGEERDVMFISLALDDEDASASFRFLEKPDLFNVAITRARQQNHVVHSFLSSRVSGDSLVGKFLAFAGEIETNWNAARVQSAGTKPTTPEQFHDQFAHEVADYLHSIDAKVSVAYPLAGQTIDLVYSKDGITRGLDLIGFPGDFSEAFPLERILTFQRAGLKIYPLAYSAWHFQREQCEAWLRGEEMPSTKGEG